MESQSLSLSSELEDPQLLPGTSRMFDAVCTDEGSDAEFENAGTPDTPIFQKVNPDSFDFSE